MFFWNKFIVFASFTYLLFLSSEISSQTSIDQFDNLKIEQFWGVDTFGALLYSEDNILYKNWNGRSWQFGDYTLGKLAYVNLMNPLRILLFYDATNTVVFLDRFFNETSRIDFTGLTNFRNVSLVSVANENNVYLFDNTTQRLELFDSLNNRRIWLTPPLQEIPYLIESTYNYCWLVGKDYIYQFNIYGSLVQKFSNTTQNITQISTNQKFIAFADQKHIFLTSVESWDPKALTITIKENFQLFLTTENLYIYQDNKLQEHHLQNLNK